MMASRADIMFCNLTNISKDIVKFIVDESTGDVVDMETIEIPIVSPSL